MKIAMREAFVCPSMTLVQRNHPSILKRFGVCKLKIDSGSVRDIAWDADDRAIVTAIIHLARSVGFITIAKDVETLANQNFLIEQGCDEVQGYLFSKPISADKIPGFIANLSH